MKQTVKLPNFVGKSNPNFKTPVFSERGQVDSPHPGLGPPTTTYHLLHYWNFWASQFLKCTTTKVVMWHLLKFHGTYSPIGTQQIWRECYVEAHKAQRVKTIIQKTHPTITSQLNAHMNQEIWLLGIITNGQKLTLTVAFSNKSVILL